MSEFTPTVTGTGARARVQRFGGFLAGMIMPNIGAFIAWGLITALFIETGWTPVPQLGGFGTDSAGEPYGGIVGPIITYLLPILIAYTGGRMVHGQRGAVIGAVAVLGVIAASRRTVVLADHTKFGREDFAKVAPLTDVDTVITDSGVDAELADDVEQAGPRVVIA